MNDQIPKHLSRSKFQFGSTDPFFPGITLGVPNLHGTTKDFQHFLFKYLAMDNSIEQFVIIQKFLNSGHDKWENFFVLCLSSAAIHELRHFHEFYGSPFGAKILSNLITNTLSLPILMQVLLTEDTIALPISAWARLPVELHTLYQANTKSGKLSRRPPNPAAIAATGAECLINQILLLYQPSKSSSLWELSTRHLLEESALSVQNMLIGVIFGEKMLESFVNMVRLYDEEKDYDRLTSIWKLVGENAVVSATVRNAILFFALCGQWWDQTPTSYTNPADRLLGVSIIANRDRRNPSVVDILSFLDDCSEEMKVPTLTESLRQSMIWFENFVARAKVSVSKAWAHLSLKQSRERLTKCLDELTASHKYMASLILENPLSFFDPAQYLERIHDWLAAPRWYRSDTYFFSPSNPALNLHKTFGEGDWFVPGFVTVEGDDNLYAPFLLSKFPTTGTNILSPDSAYQFGIDNYLGNVCWTSGGFSDLLDAKMALIFLKSFFPDKEFIFLRP